VLWVVVVLHDQALAMPCVQRLKRGRPVVLDEHLVEGGTKVSGEYAGYFLSPGRDASPGMNFGRVPDC